MRVPRVGLQQFYLHKPKGISVEEGRPLTLKVIHQSGNRALLQMGEQNISAIVEDTLYSDEIIKATVLGEKNGQVLLKVLARAPAESSLNPILREHAIQPNMIHREALLFLMNQTIPVSTLAIKAYAHNEENPIGDGVLRTLAVLDAARFPLTSAFLSIQDDVPVMTSKLQEYIGNFFKIFMGKRNTLSITKDFPSGLEEILHKATPEQRNSLLMKLLGLMIKQHDENLLLHGEIPVFLDMPTTLFIRIKEFAEQQRSNKEKMYSLFISLDTKKLGSISVHLLLQGKNIYCQFFSDQSKTCALISKHKTLLQEQLKRHNYTITNWEVRKQQSKKKALQLSEDWRKVNYRI